MESIAMARGIGYSNLLSEIDMHAATLKPIRAWGDNRIAVELSHDARSGKNSTHFARRINQGLIYDSVAALASFGRLFFVARLRAPAEGHFVPPCGGKLYTFTV